MYFKLNKLKMILFLVFFLMTELCFGATLKSMSKNEIKELLLNKTLVSIATDNLNCQTIQNTFSLYLDNKGNSFGKMEHKPSNEPQTDTGVYSISKDGTLYLTWQHWDGAKKLCAHFFNTQNAYLAIDCENVFHTVFMKETVRSGNHLKKLN